MSKVFKGIGKAVKGIVKGVKKVYKKVVESKIGKALLIGATVYLGGAALGMWNSPFQSINGVLRAGAAGSGGSTAAASAAAPSAASQMAATGTTAAQTGAFAGMPTGIETITVTGAAPSAAGASTAATIAPAAMAIQTSPSRLPTDIQSPQVPSQSEMIANGAQGVETPGILNRLLSGASERLKKTAGFVNDHPYATAMALNAAGNMLTPDAIDVMQMEQEQEEKERRRREANLDVRNINLGVSPSGRQLTYSDGTPVYGTGGILNHNVPRRV